MENLMENLMEKKYQLEIPELLQQNQKVLNIKELYDKFGNAMYFVFTKQKGSEYSGYRLMGSKNLNNIREFEFFIEKKNDEDFRFTEDEKIDAIHVVLASRFSIDIRIIKEHLRFLQILTNMFNVAQAGDTK